MDPTALLEQWQKGVRVFHMAHARATGRLDVWGRAIAVPVVILTTAAGTSVLSSGTDEALGRLVTGLMSLTAAILSGLQGVLKFRERAEQHRAAAQQYGHLRRTIEVALATPGDAASRRTVLATIQEEWDRLDGEAPPLPERRIAAAKRDVEASAARRGATGTTG